MFCVHVKVLVAELCTTLCGPPCSPPGSSIRRILQTRILEWVAITFSRGSSQRRDQAQISHTGRFFTVWPAIISIFLIAFQSVASILTFSQIVSMLPPNSQNWALSLFYLGHVTQLYSTLCDPVHSSPPNSSVHGILQAKILEWVATPFSRESFPPRD